MSRFEARAGGAGWDHLLERPVALEPIGPGQRTAWARRAAILHPTVRPVLALTERCAVLAPEEGAPWSLEGRSMAESARLLLSLGGALRVVHRAGLSLGGPERVRIRADGSVWVDPTPGVAARPDAVAGDRAWFLCVVDELLRTEGPAGASIDDGMERLRGYLDGSAGRARARLALAEDDAREEAGRALAEAQRAARAAALRASAGLRSFDPIERKEPAWRLEERAAALGRAQDRLGEERIARLAAAQRDAPEDEAVRARLIGLHRAALAAVPAGRDPSLGTPEQERHLSEIELLDRTGRHRAWCAGVGRLTLHTEVPARARLLRWVERGRLLRAEPVRDLGMTPLVAVPLEMGSWLIELRAEGHRTVRYPVRIERQQHWDGVPPDGSAPQPILLPRMEELPADAEWVPAGWSIVGPPEARRRIWVDGFALARWPVSHRAWLAWLAQLRATGEDPLPHIPRTQDGQPLYPLEEGARLFRPHSTTDSVDAPAVFITWIQARAMAQALGARLPGEYEWEKAARGVDGRTRPWGDFTDATFSWLRGRRRAGGVPLEALDRLPAADTSPYGLRGMGGGVKDLCMDGELGQGPDEGARYRPQEGDPARRERCQARGGCWVFDPWAQPMSVRFGVGPDHPHEYVGLRLAWDLDRIRASEVDR